MHEDLGLIPTTEEREKVTSEPELGRPHMGDQTVKVQVDSKARRRIAGRGGSRGQRHVPRAPHLLRLALHGLARPWESQGAGLTCDYTTVDNLTGFLLHLSL